MTIIGPQYDIKVTFSYNCDCMCHNEKLSHSFDRISHNFNFTCDKVILNAAKLTFFFSKLSLYMSLSYYTQLES